MDSESVGRVVNTFSSIKESSFSLFFLLYGGSTRTKDSEIDSACAIHPSFLVWACVCRQPDGHTPSVLKKRQTHVQIQTHHVQIQTQGLSFFKMEGVRLKGRGQRQPCDLTKYNWKHIRICIIVPYYFLSLLLKRYENNVQNKNTCTRTCQS